MNGVINLYKEKGETSFKSVTRVKKILKMKKVGHTGTLDPDAEGVLPICIGRATKLVPYIMEGHKIYKASFKLGYTSDTLDSSGTLTETFKAIPEQEKVEKEVLKFKGESMQLPPMYSALRKDGVRLYTLARQGIEIEREKRPINVYDIELVNYKNGEGQILMKVSKGTYVRSIIDDLGENLGTGAIMTDLVREETGFYNIKDSVKIEEFEKDPKKYIIAMDIVLEEYEKFVIPDKFSKFLINGVKIRDRSLVDNISLGKYRTYNSKGDFLGLSIRDENSLFLKINLM